MGKAACYACCAQNHANSWQHMQDALSSCACNPDVCQDRCTSDLGINYCPSGGMPPDGPCKTCLASAVHAGMACGSVCGSDADCQGAVDCALGCPSM